MGVPRRELIKGVYVYKITQANPADPRGPTLQWEIPGTTQLTACIRKAGSVSSHTHEGKDPAKNPEKLLIVWGKVKFIFENKKTGEKQELIAETGTEIHIYPGITHTSVVFEDACILEARSTQFDPKAPDQINE